MSGTIDTKQEGKEEEGLRESLLGTAQKHPVWISYNIFKQ